MDCGVYERMNTWYVWYVCMCLCECLCMYACMHVCMYVCVYVYSAPIHRADKNWIETVESFFTCMYDMYVWYRCMYAWMNICIYIYAYEKYLRVSIHVYDACMTFWRVDMRKLGG